MAEILQYKERLLAPKIELHIAPEGLTLVGAESRESTVFAPMSDISGTSIKKRGRKTDLIISFGPQRPAWTLRNLQTSTAQWAEALISEEKSALDKRCSVEYTKKTPIGDLETRCGSILASSNAHAAVDLVDFLLVQAVQHGASDVHFDPYADCVVVRFRLDGVLYDVARLDKSVKQRLASRLKVVSHLATFRKAVAQEGRAAVKIGDRTVDFRFSALPTIHGEKVAVRVFDPSTSIISMPSLGMMQEMRSSFESLICQPQGTVLLTGPSGSGKTTTIYSALTYLRENRKNLSSIATVEDPVEYDLQVVNQTQVNLSSGLTFANALRTVLRQDPEVIMIGEIRDSETAEIAIQAGLTGHMVLSTVHARSAAGVLLRLMDLGAEPYLLAASVSAILSQRLVRTICKNCAREHTPTSEEISRFKLKGGDRFYEGAGCEHCAGTGYAGRTGIFQLLPVSEEMRELVLRRSSLSEFEDKVENERIKSMLDDGLEKAGAGITTLEELSRVLG